MKNTRSPVLFAGAAPWNQSVTGLSVCMKVTAFKKLRGIALNQISQAIQAECG
jgi:hypothetical protein